VNTDGPNIAGCGGSCYFNRADTLADTEMAQETSRETHPVDADRFHVSNYRGPGGRLPV
jgi:hypothetical protein